VLGRTCAQRGGARGGARSAQAPRANALRRTLALGVAHAMRVLGDGAARARGEWSGVKAGGRGGHGAGRRRVCVRSVCVHDTRRCAARWLRRQSVAASAAARGCVLAREQVGEQRRGAKKKLLWIEPGRGGNAARPARE
jgi:hypothetical protein